MRMVWLQQLYRPMLLCQITLCCGVTAGWSTAELCKRITGFFFFPLCLFLMPPYAVLCNWLWGAVQVASCMQCYRCTLEGSAPLTALLRAHCCLNSLPAGTEHGAGAACPLFTLMLQFVFTAGMRYLWYGKMVYSFQTCCVWLRDEFLQWILISLSNLVLSLCFSREITVTKSPERFSRLFGWLTFDWNVMLNFEAAHLNWGTSADWQSTVTAAL